mmetsp:Transcript_17857/g.32387  ORF Transcript_17857/g.32387 Transcript_17857/m.32387 type:complete len:804 (-) Transcript_17857:5-2416(-)
MATGVRAAAVGTGFGVGGSQESLVSASGGVAPIHSPSGSAVLRHQHGIQVVSEKQKQLFRQLGSGGTSENLSRLDREPPKGSCIGRSCSNAGRVPDVEPRDIVFKELCREYGEPGDNWETLSLRRKAEFLGRALKPRGFNIDPRSPYMRYWDCIVLAALLYTATVTPYQVALVPQSYGVLFTLNCLIDGVFVKDMIMQFFLKVRVPTGNNGERWIRDPWGRAMMYLRGWFPLDLISVLPIDHVLRVVMSVHASNAAGRQARAIRILRLFRLLKLARVLRAIRVLRRWKTKIVIPFSTQALLKFLVAILTLSHWTACAWALLGRFLGTNIKCDDVDGHLVGIDSTGLGTSWITARKWAPDDPCSSLHVYAAALHFSVMSITSIGYGDVAPTRTEEHIVGIVIQLLGGITWAYIIGSACGVITNMNPPRKHHKEEMDELNQMLKRHHISPDLGDRLRYYMSEAIHHKSVVHSRELCQDFYPELRGELVMSTSIGRAITHVWYFRDCDKDFLVEVAQSMVPRFFNKQEECDEVRGMLGICQRGAVAREGRIYVTGRFWGEDMILSSEDLRTNAPIISLTYSEVLTLEHDQLDDILECSPSAARRLRHAAAIIGVLKAAKVVAAERRDQVCRSQRLHRLFEDSKDPKVRERCRRENIALAEERALPEFHRKFTEELRRFQLRTLGSLKSVRRQAGAQSASDLKIERLGASRGRATDGQTLPRSCRSSAAAASASSPAELSSAELGDLSEQVARLSLQLSRLGVAPRPPPEPPPITADGQRPWQEPVTENGNNDSEPLDAGCSTIDSL